MTDEELNAKYGDFVVTAYKRSVGWHVPIGRRTYPTVRKALDAAKRLESGRRYAGEFLFIDASPAALARVEGGYSRVSKQAAGA